MAESNEDLLFGKPYRYWLELDTQIKPLRVDRLILEISDLRGKISFYEDRIEEMNNFMILINERNKQDGK